MRFLSLACALAVLAPAALAETTPPHLVGAALDGAPWNVNSGGIAAFDVTISETGTVTSADVVQDMAPYGGQLAAALPSWRFEPARAGSKAVPSRVLVIGFFRPPMLTFAAPDNPRYKNTTAPAALPWPTHVVVAPYPPNALGDGKVALEVDVTDEGAVSAARVVSPQTAFDSSASDTVKQWQFRPASEGNKPVASRVFAVFSFVGTTP